MLYSTPSHPDMVMAQAYEIWECGTREVPRLACGDSNVMRFRHRYPSTKLPDHNSSVLNEALSNTAATGLPLRKWQLARGWATGQNASDASAAIFSA
jgi:hypothetical protein